MTYVLGAVIGAVIGCVIGWLKGVLIWKTYIDGKGSETGPDSEAMRVYPRMMISMAVNIGTLVVLFLVRNVVPFNAVAFIIGGATGLVVMNFIMANWQKARQEKKEVSE